MMGIWNNTTDIQRNITQLENEKIQTFEYTLRIVVPVFYGLIFLVGLLGNLMVMLVVVSNRTMHKPTYLLISSLAAADMLFLIFCVPFTALHMVTYVWPLGWTFCKIYGYISHVSAYLSVYTLVLMSLARYLVVLHPLYSKTICTLRNTCVIIFVTWLIVVSFNLHLIFDYNIYSYQFRHENRSTCIQVKQAESAKQGQIFTGCFFTFGYLLPLSLMCVLYGLMLRHLATDSQLRGNREVENQKTKQKVTRMVTVIVLVFALCWLPHQVISMYLYFGDVPGTIINMSFKVAAQCLMYTNSSVNPLLYAFLSNSFYDSFKVLLYKCCFPLRRTHFQQVSS